LHCYGVIPDNLRGRVIDIAEYTRAFVRKIVCGNNHCLIWFNDGQLAGFGSNEEGQLGFDFKKNENFINEIKINKFTFIDPETQAYIKEYEIWDIAAGDNFSLILVKTGKKTYLVKFGLTTEDRYRGDQEKLSSVNVVEINYEKLGNITNIYVFGQRSLLLNTENDIFVGGVDFNLNPLDKYKHIDRFPRQIKNIYMGQEHFLILDCK